MLQLKPLLLWSLYFAESAAWATPLTVLHVFGATQLECDRHMVASCAFG